MCMLGRVSVPQDWRAPIFKFHHTRVNSSRYESGDQRDFVASSQEEGGQARVKDVSESKTWAASEAYVPGLGQWLPLEEA